MEVYAKYFIYGDGDSYLKMSLQALYASKEAAYNSIPFKDDGLNGKKDEKDVILSTINQEDRKVIIYLDDEKNKTSQCEKICYERGVEVYYGSKAEIYAVVKTKVLD